ncbi:MAG: formyltetrahydrofolate deformylase, partial [Gammaproteobacteria bacterium]|nr:formyltetrahydrofolate deformylase [Gammaproteobacteria bacterium]
MKSKTAPWIFTASCPSIIGTVDVVTRYMAQAGNYVDEIHSFDDRESGRFFIRIEFLPQDADFNADVFKAEFAERAAEFDMDWSLTAPNHKPKVAIMVSKYDHCLNDLLYRFRTGQLNIDVTVIISNHPDLEDLA